MYLNMDIDATKIVEKLTKQAVKKKYTYGLSPSVADEFKNTCDRLKIAYGPAVEELMKKFIESAKKKSK